MTGAVVEETGATVVIGGVSELRNWAWTWPTTIISAVNDESNVLGCPYDLTRLVLTFDDVRDHIQPRSFSFVQAEKAVEFVAGLDAAQRERMLVHCARASTVPPLSRPACCTGCGPD